MLVEVSQAKRPQDQKGDGDEESPHREDERVSVAAAFAPALDEGMHHQPEQGNGAVDGAGQQGEEIDEGAKSHLSEIEKPCAMESRRSLVGLKASSG